MHVPACLPDYVTWVKPGMATRMYIGSNYIGCTGQGSPALHRALKEGKIARGMNALKPFQEERVPGKRWQQKQAGSRGINCCVQELGAHRLLW
ncbi:hypothetical protein MELB17_10383 [Marinobacter sp. ELB17]|nr:hypothetical protein MELB17_10383 [Marinobacter sp. ELB17]